MMALRELARFGITLVCVAFPFLVLGLLAYALDDESLGAALCAFLLAGVGLLFGPAVLLLRNRLGRVPLAMAARFDERPPVLFLHRLTRSARPWISRAPLVLPAQLRDWQEDFYETTLIAALSAAGPVLDLARPAGPVSWGPLSLDDSKAWRSDLEVRLQRSQLVAIVVQGHVPWISHEIERAVARLGWGRLMLIAPPVGDATEDWAALAVAFPNLPRELPYSAVAVRFDSAGNARVIDAPHRPARRAVLSKGSLLRGAEEQRRPERMRGAKWSAVFPFLGAMVSAIFGPFVLDLHAHELGGRLGEEEVVTAAVVFLVTGVATSLSSLSAFRFAPSTGVVPLLVATLPWSVISLITLVHTEATVREVLTADRALAVYTAPILLGLSVTLSMASLGQRTVRERRFRSAPWRFSLLSVSAFIPLVTLVLAVGQAFDTIGATLVVLALSWLVLALAIGVSADDEAPRRIPVAVAAGVAAGLSVLAAGTSLGARAFGLALMRGGQDLALLESFSALWLTLALLIPVIVVACAFAVRSSSPRGVGDLMCFAPMIFLLGAVAAHHREALDDLAPPAPEEMLEPLSQFRETSDSTRSHGAGNSLSGRSIHAPTVARSKPPATGAGAG